MKKRIKKGFTLVELLVVIAILGILATVSVVGYSAFTEKAKESVAQQELTQIHNYLFAADIDDDNFRFESNGIVFAAEVDIDNDADDNDKVAFGTEGATHVHVLIRALGEEANEFKGALGVTGYDAESRTITALTYTLDGATATLKL